MGDSLLDGVCLPRFVQPRTASFTLFISLLELSNNSRTLWSIAFPALLWLAAFLALLHPFDFRFWRRGPAAYSTVLETAVVFSKDRSVSRPRAGHHGAAGSRGR